MYSRYGRKFLLVVTLVLSGVACLVSGVIQWCNQCKYFTNICTHMHTYAYTHTRCCTVPGLHLGNNSRGAKEGFMIVRGGNGIKICMRKHTHAPRKFLYFRLFQIASGAFSGICSSQVHICSSQLQAFLK